MALRKVGVKLPIRHNPHHIALFKAFYLDGLGQVLSIGSPVWDWPGSSVTSIIFPNNHRRWGEGRQKAWPQQWGGVPGVRDYICS